MPASDLPLLLNTLKQAGQIAMTFHGKAPKRWHKKDGTLVTEADLAVDDYLKNTIMQARPDDGWLSEETPDSPHRLQKQRVWIADPIDGTRAFADGTEFWGIGLALIENGQPVVGGIYCPCFDVLYHGAKGGGAFRNAVPLVSPESAGPVIVPRLVKSEIENLGATTQISSNWPMLVRFALIAEGKNPATISIGPKQDWDLAAGVLLVTETGGLVTTQQGRPYQFNQPAHHQLGLVAAQQKWHSALLQALGKIPHG